MVTLHGKKVPVIDGTVPLSRSDFEMLKKTSAIARISMGIGEKVVIAFGAAVLLALATLAGAWVHGAYLDARQIVQPHVVVITPASDKIGNAPASGLPR
jgi:hypothetical protein